MACMALFASPFPDTRDSVCIRGRRLRVIHRDPRMPRWDASERRTKPCSLSVPPWAAVLSPALRLSKTALHPRVQRAIATVPAASTDAIMVNLNLHARRDARVALIALAIAAVGSNAAAKACRAAEFEAAEAAFRSIDSWQRLALAHQRFSQCDVGYVAEGNSKGIVRLLVDHWDSVWELSIVAAKQPAFLHFVLRHLDTTVNDADLEHIVQLATAQCPSGNRALCKSLVRAAKKAMAESCLLRQSAVLDVLRIVAALRACLPATNIEPILPLLVAFSIFDHAG